LIDIKSILDYLGVDYKEHGKNVGSSDINIDCPFCGADKHLGISLGSGLTNCWVCQFMDLKRHPSLMKVLLESTNYSYQEIRDVMIDNGWEPFDVKIQDTGSGLAPHCSLPKESLPFRTITPKRNIALKYLTKRGFDHNTIEEYDLHYTISGSFSDRIIIPIYFNETLVSFTSRRFRGGSGNRYKHSPLNMSSKRIKDLLYNYDVASDHNKIYILEGPTDVWRVGKKSVAVFRSALSRQQRDLIFKVYPKEVVIIFDHNAVSRAYEAAEQLSLFIPKIKVIRLDNERDVADRSISEIHKLEEETDYYKG